MALNTQKRKKEITNKLRNKKKIKYKKEKN